MKTKAVRLYGEMDLRLDEFELPEMQDDEIMAEVVTDSLCMSSYKAITQAQKHKTIGARDTQFRQQTTVQRCFTRYSCHKGRKNNPN